jgi:hypothetical protein
MIQRQVYHSIRSRASAIVWTGTEVINSHSMGAVSAGGSVSQVRTTQAKIDFSSQGVFLGLRTVTAHQLTARWACRAAITGIVGKFPLVNYKSYILILAKMLIAPLGSQGLQTQRTQWQTLKSFSWWPSFLFQDGKNEKLLPKVFISCQRGNVPYVLSKGHRQPFGHSEDW